MNRPPRVFISYSHDSFEHSQRVLALADRLRAEGVDARLDQYEEAPAQGWLRWMTDEIEQADTVVVVVSYLYQARFQKGQVGSKGAEVEWWGTVITQDLYNASNHAHRFIPVVLSPEDMASIPVPLRALTSYDLSREQGYEGLYYRLTGQPPLVASASFCNLVPWGDEMLHSLRQIGATADDLRTVGAGRWLIRAQLPSKLQEAYGTAPAVLLLVVQGEVLGKDLRRAHEELERHRFELDLDLLVVTDERPNLPERLNKLYQTEGQWVPWSKEGKRFPALSAAFRKYLPTQDIFSRRDAVRGRQIVGRSESISNLVRSVRRGQAAGIFGLRKVGKTTVARAVTDRLDPISAILSLPHRGWRQVALTESSIRVVWLDAGRFFERTVAAVADRLLKGLNDRLKAEFPGSIQEDQSDGLAALDRRLEEVLRASSIPVVFVIDEFDLLFEGSSGQPPIPGIEQLFQMLRGHAQETSRLVVVLIGRDPNFLESPEMGGRTNPMLGWLVPSWLGMMEPEDADLLLERLGRRVGLEVGLETLELARQWSGGHPLLHREFGSALLEIARGSETGSAQAINGHVLTDNFCNQAPERFLERHDVLTICREIFHLLSTKYPVAADLLHALAGSKGEEHAQLLVSQGGWQRPENRILRNFGLVQGSSDQPEIPRFLTWYLQTFEPELRRQA